MGSQRSKLVLVMRLIGPGLFFLIQTLRPSSFFFSLVLAWKQLLRSFNVDG